MHGCPAGISPASRAVAPGLHNRSGLFGGSKRAIIGSWHDFLQLHIDFLTGRIWLVPMFKTETSSAAATNFISSVIQDVDLPNTLVSDRDTRLTTEL